MSSKDIHIPNQNPGTNAVDRNAQYDQNVDRCLKSGDGNNRTNELPLTTEHEAWQDEPNEFTPLNQDSFTGTIAWASMRHNSPQPATLTLKCLTRFDWATEVFEELFTFSLIISIFLYFYTSYCYFMVFFLMLKSNPTTNRHFRTSVIMRGYKAPSTKKFFAVLFGITDVNREVFVFLPWPHRTSTKQNLRCKWTRKKLQ